MSVHFSNLDSNSTFQELLKTKEINLRETLTADRIQQYQIPMVEDLRYYFSTKKVNNSILTLLQKLANEQQVIEKYKDILQGHVYNTSEKRMVLHHLTRGQLLGNVYDGDKNVREFYQSVLDRIETFSQKVHEGQIISSTGKKFDTVVQVGIGGSDLGPKALYLALEQTGNLKLKGHFVSNVDPDDMSALLASINIETTLFIVVSKSGTTQETLTNLEFVRQSAKEKNIDLKKQIVAVTSETSPLAKSNDFLDSFFIDDYIGGRYSATSPVGGVIFALAFGFPVFKEILEGANASDKQALESDIWKNPALLDALLGLYERNVLGKNSSVILPYSQALQRFPAHLQQLDMESNGKHVSRSGETLSYQTGPFIWGEPGTNGQHSFYQLLHQGTEAIPLQFIGFKDSQRQEDIDFEGSSSQEKLNANLIAQLVAFSCGKENKEDTNKDFLGERPCSLIFGKKLTPKALGALLAHYENKVMFQGLLWNVNSFDQEGVQLGKVLTSQILEKKMDPVLKKWADIVFY